MPGGAADFIVGAEVRPVGSGLKTLAADTKTLTAATKESGEAIRRAAGAATESERATRRQTDETRRSTESTRRAEAATRELEQAERRRRVFLEQMVQSIRAQNLALAQARTDHAQYQQRIEAAAEAKRRATGVVNSFRAAIVALQVTVAALGLGALVRDSVNVALAFDRANKSLVAATGSQQLAGREMAFVSAEADRLGLVLKDTGQAYARLSAASRGTSLAGQQTRDIFSAIAESSTVLGLSAEETAGTLKALQDMISKGTVQAEELRGQLGDRLPGAFQLAARAMGVTTAELGKMLEGGQVMAADLLPKLAAELRKTFGPGLVNAVNSAQANLNRLQNAVDQVKGALGEGFLAGFLAGFADLKEALSAEDLKAAARDLGENIGKALRTAADIGLLLVKNLELVKAVLLIILATKAAAWFISLAGAIATATGATLTFKGALSSLAIAGPLAAIGVALLAVIVIMERYISTTRLAHEAEMGKVAKSQEVFGYYQTLKANKVGLTQAEAAYALEVRKTMEAERAALAVSLERTRAQLQASMTLNPFKYHQVAGPGRNALREQVTEQERELKTIENQLNILDSQWERLGKLPTINLPVDAGAVDEAAKKVADLLTGFQRTVEQAERIRAAQERGGTSEVARVTAEIERQNAAYQALHSVEGLSASAKQRLTGIIEGLVGRAQEATRATAEGAAETARSLAFTASAAEAEARLADVKSQTAAASREAAIQAEAEGIARENLREEDSEYVAGLLRVIRVRHDYLASIALEVAAVERQIAHASTLRQRQAELADAVEQGTDATRRLAVEIEAETEARARGIEKGTIWYQLLLAIAAQRAREVEAINHQVAAQQRLNDAQAAQRQARAEFTDWSRQREAAKEYGSEIAGILQSYGLLSEATRRLALHEQALAQFREAGNTRTLEQIEAELKGYAAIEESLARVAAATELQAYVVQPVVDAWAQVGQVLQDAVIDAIVEGKVEVEDLAKTILRTMLSAIAEMLKRWILAQRAMQAEAMRTAAVNAAAAQAGGGGGVSGAGIGSNLGGGFGSWGAAGGTGAAGAGTSTAFAAGATVAIFAAIYFGVSQWIKTNKDQIAKVTFRLQEDVGGAVHDIHGNSRNVEALTNQIQDAGKAVVDWLKSIGGALESAGSVSVWREGQGKNTSWFVQVAGGVKEWFKSQEEAFSFAMVQSLKQAEISGLSPIVTAAINRTTARTWEELQAQIADATKVASFGEAQASGELRGVTLEMDRLRESMRKLLGPSAELNDALARINAQEVMLLQSQRDALTGRQRTAAEEHQLRLLEIEVWNKELALRKANIAVQIIEQKAKIEAYRGSLWLIGGGGGASGAGKGRGGNGGLIGLGAAFTWLAGVAATSTNVLTSSGDAALDALNEQLAALQALQDALGQIKPIDPSEVVPAGRSGGGGGGDRKQGRLDLLDEVAGWKLTDVGRQLRDAGAWFDDFRERLKDLGFSAAKQAELLAAAAAELARRQAEIKATQLAASADFDKAGTAGGGPLISALNANKKTQTDLIAANRDLWRAGQLSLREMRELNNAIREAGERQRQQMVTSAAGSLLLDLYNLLGMEKEAAQARFDLTLAELEIRRAELAIAMEMLGWEQSRRDVVLNTIDGLINKVREIGPAIFGPGGAGGGGAANDNVPRFRGYDSSGGGEDPWRLVNEALATLAERRIGVSSRDEFEVERLSIIAEFENLRKVLEPVGRLAEVNETLALVLADLEVRRQERDNDLLRPYEDLALDPFQRELQALEREFAHIRETVADTARVEAAHALALQDLMRQYTEGLRSWYDELTGGAASGLNVEQQYNAQMARYSELLAQIQAGDLSKTGDLEAAGRLLEQLAGQQWGSSTGGTAELRARLRRDLEQILGLTGTLSDDDGYTPPSGLPVAGAPPPAGAPLRAATFTEASSEKQVEATDRVSNTVDLSSRRVERLLTEAVALLTEIRTLGQDVRDEVSAPAPTTYGSTG